MTIIYMLLHQEESQWCLIDMNKMLELTPREGSAFSTKSVSSVDILFIVPFIWDFRPGIGAVRKTWLHYCYFIWDFRPGICAVRKT